jgi:hypothetical protein
LGKPFLPYPNGPNSRPSQEAKKAGWFGGGSSKRKEGWENYEWEQNERDVMPTTRYMFWRFVGPPSLLSVM